MNDDDDTAFHVVCHDGACCPCCDLEGCESRVAPYIKDGYMDRLEKGMRAIQQVISRWFAMSGVKNTPGAMIRHAENLFEEIQKIIEPFTKQDEET